MGDKVTEIVLSDQLKGHGGWVTAIATNSLNREVLPETDMVLTASRDKSLIVWKNVDSKWVAAKRLTGHSHFIQDVAISSDGHFALSGSWDGTLRLWEINTGVTTRRFVGHTKDVLSVAFSVDNRQIVSGSRDNTIKLWNTLGQCKYTIMEDGHKEWVSCVRFSPAHNNGQKEWVPLIVSAGWDKVVKVWNLHHCKLRTSLMGHTGYISTVTVSPDGSLCASGGKDGTAMLWDLNEGRHLSSLEAGDIIHALVFSPRKYWLCAATASAIKIWDLESKVVLATLELPKKETAPGTDKPHKPHKPPMPIQCISLAWSGDGYTLFAGYTDNILRVWSVSP